MFKKTFGAIVGTYAVCAGVVIVLDGFSPYSIGASLGWGVDVVVGAAAIAAVAAVVARVNEGRKQPTNINLWSDR